MTIITILNILQNNFISFAATIFPQCGGCETFQFNPKHISEIAKKIVIKTEYNEVECNQTMTWTLAGGNVSSVVDIVVSHRGGNSKCDTIALSTQKTFNEPVKRELKLNLKCSEGKWYYNPSGISRGFEITPLFFYFRAFFLVAPDLDHYQHCDGCIDLQSGGSYTPGMTESRSKVTGVGCHKEIWCLRNNPNAVQSISLELLDGLKGLVTMGSGQDMLSVYVYMHCYKGNWYLDGYPDMPLTNKYYCETAPVNSSRYFESCPTNASSIETTKVITSTASEIATAPINTPTTQNPNNYHTSGFESVTPAANPLSAGLGKFVGYFQNQSFCKKVCEQSNNILTCIGYTFDPDNKGKCTIYQIGPPIKSILC